MSAKATSGLRRAGSSPRASSALRAICRAVCSSAACAAFACGPPLDVLRVQPGDQVFERSRFFGQIGRALLLRAERLLGRRQGLLPRVDEFGEARRLKSQRSAGLREAVALARNRHPRSREFVDIVGKRLRLGFEARDNGAKEGRRPHRLRHVLGLDQDRRRRIGAHALQRRENLGNRISPAVERAGQRISLGVEARQSFVGRGDSAFGVLHFPGRLDQRLREPGPVGADRFRLRLDGATLLVRLPNRVLDAAQFGLFLRLLLFRRRGNGRGGIGARLERPAQRRPKRGGADPQLHRSASPRQHRARPRPPNLVYIAAVSRDDRDGLKESSPPGKAARTPWRARADAARSWRRS